MIRVQQYSLRFRAERLRNQIQSLYHGETSLESARSILAEWNPTYHGACELSDCFADVVVNDFAYSHIDFFSKCRCFDIYGVLGGRPTRFGATVSFHDRVVRRVSYGISVEVLPRESKALGRTPFGYTLIGGFTNGGNLPQRSLRPPNQAYSIEWPGGCEVCIAIGTHLTPAATASDIERLSQFQFGCLTRWLHPCADKRDIMPAAWAEAKSNGQPGADD